MDGHESNSSADSVAKGSADSLPSVDVAALQDAVTPDHPAVVALREACCTTGFFLVKGHGLPESLFNRVFELTERFFDLPMEVKSKYIGSADTAWRGYGPYGSGQNCNLEVKRPELKETFYCGQPPASTEGVPEPWGGFYECLRQLHSALLQLSRALLRGLSLSLRLEADHLEKLAFQDPIAKLLLAFYPPAAAGGEISCGSHTDCGFLTLVCQDSDESQALQVQQQDGSWLSVKTGRYTPVANLGDLAQRWTNDLYRSSKHRVLNASKLPRRSVVFFNNMDQTAEVTCLETCVSEERPAKYARTTCGSYVTARLNEMRTLLDAEKSTLVEDPERGVT